ncbi:hypothetical protein D3C80_1644740 [compost metagenome]
MSGQDGLADALAQLRGERHRMPGQDGDVQLALAQGRGHLHGDETVADDHHLLPGPNRVENLPGVGDRTQHEDLRQIDAR